MWPVRLSERCTKMKEPDLQEPGQRTISLALIPVQRKKDRTEKCGGGCLAVSFEVVDSSL